MEETFNVDPWSFTWNSDPKNKVSPDTSRFVAWWACKMVFTNRPLQQNLALFWHNHFAVAESKIQNGPMMLGYLKTLEDNANGNFRKTLSAVSRDPAMIKWLDSDLNIKGKPNENFAREVMELFTLGIGNYTEKDVQEAARAFTGWSIRPALINPGKMPYYDQVVENLKTERPMIVYSDCPALHDDGFKTILGKRAQFDAEGVFDHLLKQPSHAPFLMKKMWEWFVYPNPEPAVLERMCKVYNDNKYEIKPVLAWMASTNEFWSDKAQRAVVKSPVAYTISICRQLELQPVFAKVANMNVGMLEPASGQFSGLGYFLANVMNKQGLGLLNPPDVSGWRWGTHWITTASMIERVRIGDYLFKQRQGLVVPHMWQRINDTYQPQTTEDVVNALVVWFDAPIDDDAKKILVKAADAAGGAKGFAKVNTAGKVIDSVFKLIASVPQYQMT